MLDREIIEEEIERVRGYIRYLEAQKIEDYGPRLEYALTAAHERLNTLYWVLGEE